MGEEMQKEIDAKLKRIETLDTVLNWGSQGAKGSLWKSLYMRYLELQQEVVQQVAELEGLLPDVHAR